MSFWMKDEKLRRCAEWWWQQFSDKAANVPNSPRLLQAAALEGESLVEEKFIQAFIFRAREERERLVQVAIDRAVNHRHPCAPEAVVARSDYELVDWLAQAAADVGLPPSIGPHKTVMRIEFWRISYSAGYRAPWEYLDGQPGSKGPAIIWEWDDCPEQYKALSPCGGDEDWVIRVPNRQAFETEHCGYPRWLEVMDVTSRSGEGIEVVELACGGALYFVSHA